MNSFKTLGKDTDFEVFIGKPAGNTEEELLVNVNLSNYPLRELKSLIKASNAAVAQFDTMGKRNKKKDALEQARYASGAALSYGFRYPRKGRNQYLPR